MITWMRHKKHKLRWGHRRTSFWLDRACRAPYPSSNIEINSTHYLHLVGGIHLGCKAMHPLPDFLVDRIKSADAIVVEADISAQQVTFPSVLKNRIEPFYHDLNFELKEKLVNLLAELGLAEFKYDAYLPWHLAMILQTHQAFRLGLTPEYSIDAQVLACAKTLEKPIIELEGQSKQLELLSSFPKGGVDLLVETLMHWETNADILRAVLGAWLRGDDLDDSQIEIPDFTQSHLLGNRNSEWANKILSLPNGNYVVAVGALHLLGEHNLQNAIKTALVI